MSSWEWVLMQGRNNGNLAQRLETHTRVRLMVFPNLAAY